jgi:hypothetical protein
LIRARDRIYQRDCIIDENVRCYSQVEADMLGAAMKESMKNHTNVISPGSDVASDEIAEFDRDDLEGKPHTLPCIVYRQESNMDWRAPHNIRHLRSLDNRGAPSAVSLIHHPIHRQNAADEEARQKEARVQITCGKTAQ